MNYILDGKMHKLDTPEELTGFFATALANMCPSGPPPYYYKNEKALDAEFGEDFFSQATGIHWFSFEGHEDMRLRVTFKDVLVPYEGNSIRTSERPINDKRGLPCGTKTVHFATDEEFENTSNRLVNIDGQWMRVESLIPMLHGYSMEIC